MSKTQRQKDLKHYLSSQFPRISLYDLNIIKTLANSPNLRKLRANDAGWLAAVSYIRHNYTNYEQHLTNGLDKDTARFLVAQDIKEKLAEWGMYITMDVLTRPHKSETRANGKLQLPNKKQEIP
ncbi:DUF2293 domain-containing protein [Polycladidibacter stylochi]|uniref:DUF2293 domain-containing protein n=1 Tax=Polycladidibacter stylochi TaxID=1807766 RepID=UPI00082E2693|nr:DUF2293 domain-containing protein [Pseudovibrio stylochi]